MTLAITCETLTRHPDYLGSGICLLWRLALLCQVQHDRARHTAGAQLPSVRPQATACIECARIGRRPTDVHLPRLKADCPSMVGWTTPPLTSNRCSTASRGRSTP